MNFTVGRHELWAQGIDRPKEQPSVPKKLNWDLWLGPAPERPYHPAYHPRTWRGWWDFGCGALGDMGPHLIDPAFWALKLDSPTTVEAESSPVNDETAPQWSIVRFEFPECGDLPPVKLTWCDGGKQPPQKVTSAKRPPSNGTLIIGSRAKVFAPELGARPIIVPNDKSEKIEQPRPFIPVSAGHHDEWLRACKGEGKAGSEFTYASKLTETCLLGNIAIQCGQKIQWDSKAMRVSNCE